MEHVQRTHFVLGAARLCGEKVCDLVCEVIERLCTKLDGLFEEGSLEAD